MDVHDLARLIDPDGRPRTAGSGRLAVRCPSHEDKNPSLTVWVDDSGKAAMNCHAGCDHHDIVRALPDAARREVESTWKAPEVTVLVPRRRHTPTAPREPASRNVEGEYPYEDDEGNVAFVVRRFRGKRIRQFHQENGQLVSGRGDSKLYPYRLTDVLEANKAGDIIYIVEGEKDADRLASEGLVATCNVGGAGKWTEGLNGWFVGAHVRILPDNDEPGRKHAEDVLAHLRDVADSCRIIELDDLPDKGDVSDWLEDHSVDELERLAHENPADLEPDPDLAAFLDSPEPEYDWIIEGLLERGDRVILTGTEGSGKSTLWRQAAVMVGSGIHPFTMQDIPPRRVLYVDLENSVKHTRRQLRPLRAKAGQYLRDGYVIPLIRPEGLDLLLDEDREWLTARIEANQPDILIIGPVYKLVGGDPTEEQPAKAAATLLDHLRTEHGFALLLEAHSPHGESGRKRPKRPYGASLWLRWPEFGLHIDERGNLSHWRGARDEREWPTLLRRGGEWPWSRAISEQELLWGRILQMSESRMTRPSFREMEMELAAARGSLQRAIDAHKDEWEAMWKE